MHRSPKSGNRRVDGRPLLLLTLVTATAAAGSNVESEWPDRTRVDLATMHKLIVEAHPGVIDEENPAFALGLEHSYRQANRLAAQVRSDGDSLAVLRYYVAGFEDGHLGVGRQGSRTTRWAGFIVGRRGGHFVVEHAAEQWPVPLPAVGARLVSCAGRSPDAIIEEDLSPFIDRRLDLESTRLQLASFLTIAHRDYPVLERALPSRCLLDSPDGARHELPLRWQESNGRLTGTPAPMAQPFALVDLGQGRYWVRVPRFMADAAEHASLQRLLGELGDLADARWVIFDVRGNSGGNSLIGAQLLRALLGDRADDGDAGRPPAYALWRASPFALGMLEDALKATGETDETHALLLELHRSMTAALAEGRPWVRQPDLAPTHPITVEATMRRFSGRLALVTDTHCASACLDFADRVLDIPGTLHLGLPTSADSHYIDIGQHTLPSGARFWLPLKVWRNRARGHNQGYEPGFRYPGDIDDSAALQAWVLDVLKRSQ